MLDASAVLAYLLQEAGFEQVHAALVNGAAISTVNLAEVYARIVARGLNVVAVAQRLAALGLTALPFMEEDARASAALYPQAQTLGLSLADRACLALGRRLGLPVLTTDRTWTRAPFGVEIRLLR